MARNVVGKPSNREPVLNKHASFAKLKKKKSRNPLIDLDRSFVSEKTEKSTHKADKANMFKTTRASVQPTLPRTLQSTQKLTSTDLQKANDITSASFAAARRSELKKQIQNLEPNSNKHQLVKFSINDLNEMINEQINQQLASTPRSQGRAIQEDDFRFQSDHHSTRSGQKPKPFDTLSKEDADKMEVLSSEMRTAQRMLTDLRAKMDMLKNEKEMKIELKEQKKNGLGSSKYNLRAKELEERDPLLEQNSPERVLEDQEETKQQMYPSSSLKLLENVASSGIGPPY